MPANTIYGPDTLDPILSEASAYAYAVAKLHTRVQQAAAPGAGVWDLGPHFAEIDFHHYIHWALSAYGNLRNITTDALQLSLYVDRAHQAQQAQQGERGRV